MFQLALDRESLTGVRESTPKRMNVPLSPEMSLKWSGAGLSTACSGSDPEHNRETAGRL